MRPVYPEAHLSLCRVENTHRHSTFSAALAASPSGMFLMHTQRTVPHRGVSQVPLLAHVELFRTFFVARQQPGSTRNHPEAPDDPPSDPPPDLIPAEPPTNAGNAGMSGVGDVEMVDADSEMLDADIEVSVEPQFCVHGIHEAGMACIAAVRAAITARGSGAVATRAAGLWEVAMVVAAGGAMHIEHMAHNNGTRNEGTDKVRADLGCGHANSLLGESVLWGIYARVSCVCLLCRRRWLRMSVLCAQYCTAQHRSVTT